MRESKDDWGLVAGGVDARMKDGGGKCPADYAVRDLALRLARGYLFSGSRARLVMRSGLVPTSRARAGRNDK